jgi:Domain of unknown function (DUF4386)
MTHNKLFRTAGWCSLVAAISIPFALISFILSGTAPSAGMIGMIFEILSLLLLVFVFYALSIAHRAESKWLGFAGLILFIASIVMDILSQQAQSAVLFGVYYMLFSLPFLIFGYLAWRSNRMPRLLAVLALLTGGITFIAGVIDLFGKQNMADSIQSISILFMLAWEVWLWRVLVSKKFAAASPAPAAAPVN